MKIYKCDKCRKELGVEKLNHFRLEETLNSTDGYELHLNIDLCDKCKEEFLRQIKLAINWREKLR